MSRYQVRRLLASVALTAAVGVGLGGCGVISLERLTVSVWPKDANAVLPSGSSPWVQFPSEPDQASVERLFTLASPSGSVAGDFRWDGLKMYFDPAPPLSPGVRYVMHFRGRVTLTNGESFDASEEVPFFIVHSSGGPLLTSSAPTEGGTAGTTTPLVLSFSAPVDANSFAREFTLQPSMETVETWSGAGKEVTITPKDPWTTLTTYTWTLTRNLVAPDGTPTGVDYTGHFRIQLDSTSPSVLSVVPGLKATLTATGSPLPPGADDVLLLQLSEDVTQDSLSSAFTLTPSTKGTLVRVTSGPPAVFAFVPEGRFVMGQSYVLRIGTGVTDFSGNKMSSAYELPAFTPAIPLQAVQCIQAVDAPAPDSWTAFNTLDAKLIAVATDTTLTLVITFAEPFTTDAEIRLLSGLTFDAYFPASLPDPSLVSASWSPAGRVLNLTWSGLEKSDATTGNYYKLLLPGGAASDNGSGSFLKDDVWLYFLTNQ